MGFLNDLKAKVLGNFLTKDQLNNLYIAMARYFIRYNPELEVVYNMPKNGLVGNMVWSSSDEACQNNIDAYINDLSLFFSLLGTEGGELTLFSFTADEHRLYAYVRDSKGNGIAAVSADYLNENMNSIKQSYGLDPEFNLIGYDIPIDVFLSRIKDSEEA